MVCSSPHWGRWSTLTPESSRSQRSRTRVLRWVGSLFLRRLAAHLWLLRASSGPKALQQFSIQPPDAAEVQFRFQSLFISQLIASK